VTARDRARRLLPAALAVAGAVAVAAGAALVTEPPVLEVAEAHAAPAAVGGVPVSSVPAAGPSAVGTPDTVPVPVPVRVAEPVRVAVPDAGVTAEVVPVGVEPSGALHLPDDPRVAGWWSSGAVPGAGEGSTVLAAHVDAAGVGAGPMSRVLRVPVGTPVEVTTADGGLVHYAVVERRSYAKADGLPAELFRADGPPRLVLITCGGAFDAASGRYADNVVVVAAPA
jgi:hypothetical protein